MRLFKKRKKCEVCEKKEDFNLIFNSWKSNRIKLKLSFIKEIEEIKIYKKY